MRPRLSSGKNKVTQQLDLDKKLVYSLSKSKIPNLKQLKYAKKFLSPRELLIMRASSFVLLASLAFLGVRFYMTHVETVPAKGGEYIEGLVGYPKYINPLYSTYSDVDNDLSGLIYSSLLKRDADGQLKDDLAESYTLSPDGKTYTFKIRKDARWTSGSPVTVDDIIFTFNTIKDGRYKSPLKDDFKTTGIRKLGDDELAFVLSAPYAPFPSLLTFGVMPQELWYQIQPSSIGLAELNLKPVGSGPYKFKSLLKDSSGQIRAYTLVANDAYYGKKPYITTLTFDFFSNFEEAVNALNENTVDGISYLPRNLEGDLISKGSLRIYRLNLSAIEAVFFNQKTDDALKDKAVRQALSLAIDKGGLVRDVFKENARTIDGPILPDSFAFAPSGQTDFDADKASQLLADDGWQAAPITADDLKSAQATVAAPADTKAAKQAKKDAQAKLDMGPGQWLLKNNSYLKITLTIIDTDENQQVAQAIKTAWENIGVKTDIESVPAAQIGQNVVKPRNFEALLYGQMLEADPDAYAFWHSSQTGENGLNIAGYANKEADSLLEDGRASSNPDERKADYQKFQEIIRQDAPAVFLYSPDYIYVQGKNVKGFEGQIIYSPRDRLAGISDWYIKSGKRIIW